MSLFLSWTNLSFLTWILLEVEAVPSFKQGVQSQGDKGPEVSWIFQSTDILWRGASSFWNRTKKATIEAKKWYSERSLVVRRRCTSRGENRINL